MKGLAGKAHSVNFFGFTYRSYFSFGFFRFPKNILLCSHPMALGA